jgi:hypothetical protein
MAKRAGRPPIPEEERRSRNLTFRSRGKLHEQLQAAAAASGRSISEEIERRLDQSFWYDDVVGSAEIAELAREAIVCAAGIKKNSSEGLEADNRARDVLRAALLELFYPTDHHYTLKLSPQEFETFSSGGVTALDAEVNGKVRAQLLQGRSPLFKLEAIDPQTAQTADTDGESS